MQLKKIKRAILYVLVFPQYIRHRIKGVNDKYENFANFFRLFPFGTINVKNNLVSFSFLGRRVILNYGHLTPLAAAILGNNEYDCLDVRGRKVIDVGASLGDTAIYFSLKGAKHVYAYELNKRNFELAKLNIDINNLQLRIDLEYCGVASHKIDSSESVLSAIMPAEDAREVNQALFKTLDQIVLEHSLSAAVLKVDVDGYEYDIFSNTTNETLNKFDSIFIEYHFGVQDLVNILQQAGFNVYAEKVNTIFAPHHNEEYRHMDVGYIHATK